MEIEKQQPKNLSNSIVRCVLWMFLGAVLHFILSTLFIDLLAFIESRTSDHKEHSQTILYNDCSWVVHGWFVVIAVLIVMELLHRLALVNVESKIDVAKAYITERLIKKHETELLEVAGRRKANSFSNLSPSEKNAIFDTDVRSASEKYSAGLSLFYNTLKIITLAVVISLESIWFLCPLIIIVMISLALNYFSGRKIEELDVGFREIQTKAALRVRHFFESNDEIRGSGAKRKAIESVSKLQDQRTVSAMEKVGEHSTSSDNQSILQNRFLLITLAGFAYFVLFWVNNKSINTDLHGVMIIIPFFLKEIPNIMGYLTGFGSERLQYSKAAHAEKRLDKFSLSDADQGVNIDTSQVSMRAENASLSFRTRRSDESISILENISTTLPDTGIVSIVGKSGSGKSSFAKLLLGLHRPEAGAILINEESLNDINEKSLSDVFSYSPQKPILFQDTIQGNLLLDEQPNQNQIQILDNLDALTLLLEKGLNQQCSADDETPNNIATLREKVLHACEEASGINFTSLTKITLPKQLSLCDAMGYHPKAINRLKWLHTFCPRRKKILNSGLGSILLDIAESILMNDLLLSRLNTYQEYASQSPIHISEEVWRARKRAYWICKGNALKKFKKGFLFDIAWTLKLEEIEKHTDSTIKEWMEDLKTTAHSDNLLSSFQNLEMDEEDDTVHFKKRYSPDSLIVGASWFDNILFSVYEANNLTKKEKIHYALLEQIKANPDWKSFLINQGLQFEIKPDSMNLSGGQTHKVAIARALLQEANITVLDEPTSSYDSLSTSKLIECLQQLSKDRLFIIVTHNVTVLKASDHSIMFDQGSLIAQGDPTQLLDSNTHYKTLFNLK